MSHLPVFVQPPAALSPCSLPAPGPGVRPGGAGDLLRAAADEAPLAALSTRTRSRAGLGDHKHHRQRAAERASGPIRGPALARHHLRVGPGRLVAAGRGLTLRPCH